MTGADEARAPAMIRLGCLGYGAWGRNLARVAATVSGARLVALADVSAERRAEAAERLPGVEVHDDDRQLLERDDIDAVLIGTTAVTHTALVCAAAAAGKHVFVEKPMALDPESAQVAAHAAEESGVLLQVGHLLRYHPAVEVLLHAAREELGTIRCAASQRLNFGSVRHDENVLFSLGPHDLSLMLVLFGEAPVSVAAHGRAFVRRDVEDLAFVTLQFPGGGIGQMHLSWLDPHKVRRMTVVGERGMAVFDDMEPREKVRIYDNTVHSENGAWAYGENLALRGGEIRIPPYAPTEPLSVEIAHFVDCVKSGRTPRTNAAEGILVTRILHAAQESIRSGGATIEL